jgi:hypothetical protein
MSGWRQDMRDSRHCCARDRQIQKCWGVVLTGSHAQGLATPWSDYDIRVILRDEAGVGTQTRYPPEGFPNIDLRVMPLREFADYARWDTPFAWDRYSFAHAQVLEDRTGDISALVEEKGRIPAEHQSSFVLSSYRCDSIVCLVTAGSPS